MYILLTTLCHSCAAVSSV